MVLPPRCRTTVTGAAGTLTGAQAETGAKMGGPDYNTGGFSDSGDGIFADPGNDPGSIDDYNSWDWKQIMAAINGMSAGTGSDANQERAKGISDPQSLMDAAGHFLNAEVVLVSIAKSLADQANALAGENGPWKGPRRTPSAT